MKFSHALILASSLAFFACGGDDDSPTAATPKNSSSSAKSSDSAKSSSSSEVASSYDCSVTDGVNVVYPTESETFKVGDEITVIFGTDVEDNGYRIIYKDGTSDPGVDLLEESYEAKMDGKTCNEVKVKLDAELGVEPTMHGIIRVQPYNKSRKGNNSALFIVKE